MSNITFAYNIENEPGYTVKYFLTGANNFMRKVDALCIDLKRDESLIKAS